MFFFPVSMFFFHRCKTRKDHPIGIDHSLSVCFAVKQTAFDNEKMNPDSELEALLVNLC